MAEQKFRLIIESHPAYILRSEIAKHNIRGYSKMKKAQIVDLMLANRQRFNHIKKMYVRKPRKKTVRKKKTTMSNFVIPYTGSGMRRRRRRY